jgi:heme exporter protein B
VLVALRRDLLLGGRRRSEVLTALFFFVVVVSLFPIGVGPDPALLKRIGPGVLWVAALLATLLGMPRLFAADHADGTLEQMALSSQSFMLQMAGKVAAHWLLCGLPLVVLAPLLGLQFDLDANALIVLSISLLIGTPLLSLIGAIGAALTLGVRGSGALLALLVLPLFIPALVFGAGAVEAQTAGLSVRGHLSLLGAMLALAVFFAPWAVTASLRIAME